MKLKQKHPDPEKEKAMQTLEMVARGLGFSINELLPPSESTANKDELLTIKQAASLLNVSTFTVRRRIAEGCFEAIKLHPGHNGSVRIPKMSIQNWISRSKG
jgi:excisionase family DNA binding protein